MNYPLNEIFLSLQGEGFFAGTAAVFVRLQGCSVGCAWCDTRHSWKLEPSKETTLAECLKKEISSDAWCWSSTEAICDAILSIALGAKHVVISGGEPADHDLRPLTSAIITKLHMKVSVETSGTAFVSAHPDTWITVSPKYNIGNKKPLSPETLLQADEWKYPIARERDFDRLESLLERFPNRKAKIISVQPVSLNQAMTHACIERCLKHNWRLSIQQHKFLNLR